MAQQSIIAPHLRAEPGAQSKIDRYVVFHEKVLPSSLLPGKPAEPVTRGFKYLLLQYWEDLSDRQLERYLRENLAAKWFCAYGLQEDTPDHSYFGKLRKRIGAEKLCELFNEAIALLESAGYPNSLGIEQR